MSSTRPCGGEPIIHRLGAPDVGRFRLLRLESLDSAPAAYSTDSRNEAQTTRADLSARLSRDLVLGAECSRQLVGIVGLQRLEGSKHAHRGIVWGLYVVPTCRRRGIARQLMTALEAQAAHDLEILELEVVSGNAPAHALYKQIGYCVYGIQPKALKVDGLYYDQILMSKTLTPGAGLSNVNAGQ